MVSPPAPSVPQPSPSTSAPAGSAAAGLPHFWAVVPAGGAGTRLWPLSRRAEPKFLRDVTGGGRSLLQATCDRLVPLAADRFLVVTGAAHREAVAAQLEGLGRDAVLVEPSARDSMAAIGLAAALLERRDPDAVMGSFAADHVIGDDGRVPCGRRHRRRGRPPRPAGHDRDRAHPRLHRLRLRPPRRGPRGRAGRPRRRGVRREAGRGRRACLPRPPVATAGTRACSWCAPPCCWTCWPASTRASPPTCARSRRRRPGRRLEQRWDALPRIALDHAVAEPAADAGEVAVVPGDPSAGTTWATSTRSPGCWSRAPDGLAGARRRRSGARRWTPPAWSSRAPGGPWWSSGWPTWSSSTPPTRCWSPRERARRRSNGPSVAAGRGAGRPHLTRVAACRAQQRPGLTWRWARGSRCRGSRP